MPAPLTLYIAVVDGLTPDAWPPFAGGQPLGRINRAIATFEAEPIDPQHYRGARISYLTRDISTLEDDDTPGIVGALVDGSDFTGTTACPKLAERADRLETLALMLLRQTNAYFKYYGFRIWLVSGAGRAINASKVGLKLKQPVASTLGLKPNDIAFDLIEHEMLLEHVCKTAARDAALREPFIQMTTT